MGQSRGFIFGIILGAAVTTGLFLLMQQLIDPGKADSTEPDPTPEIKITNDIDDDEEIEEDEVPEEVDPVEPPPLDPIDPDINRDGDGTDIDYDGPGRVDVEVDTNFQLDTEAMPVFRIDPPYPASELRRGREGYVTVEFTVTAEGDVVDIRVIEATSQAFARSAAATVAQWRYRPKRVNGQPVETRGVRVTLEFTIAQDE